MAPRSATQSAGQRQQPPAGRLPGQQALPSCCGLALSGEWQSLLQACELKLSNSGLD